MNAKNKDFVTCTQQSVFSNNCSGREVVWPKSPSLDSQDSQTKIFKTNDWKPKCKQKWKN